MNEDKRRFELWLLGKEDIEEKVPEPFFHDFLLRLLKTIRPSGLGPEGLSI